MVIVIDSKMTKITKRKSANGRISDEFSGAVCGGQTLGNYNYRYGDGQKLRTVDDTGNLQGANRRPAPRKRRSSGKFHRRQGDDGRGFLRKRMRLENQCLSFDSSPSSGATRSDDDSGFGCDGGESLGPLGGGESPQNQRALPALTNPRFNCVTLTSHSPSTTGRVPATFVSSTPLQIKTPQRLVVKGPQLDTMTEEANELPDHFIPSSCSNFSPKIVSFKNVPSLLVSTSSLALPQNEFLQTAKMAVNCISQSRAQHSSADQNDLSVTTTRVEKSLKKKSKTHPLEGNFPNVSSDGTVKLVLLKQPEEQHRARYQTEGSRGAVKDRDGSGHPCVQLIGYREKTSLQVFVASDGGLVSPHLFYQACRVTGKNSTNCTEEKVDGTSLINIAFTPDSDMIVNCDCVGILKERNVDVEQRLKLFTSSVKKKSSKCRFVFRVTVTLSSGRKEVLQVVSLPINCTQPPGLPEILRMSKSKCSVKGGEELMVIGKNFSKDSKLLFQELHQGKEVWSCEALPEKDFLHSTHLICEIPRYKNELIDTEVEVQLMVISNCKVSDSHPFHYTPIASSIKELRTNAPLPQILSRGVSPSALKLNQLYAESCGGLPFSSREFRVLSAATPALTSTGTEQANPPQKVCATVNPLIQTTPRVSMKSTTPIGTVHTSSSTTPVLLTTPKPTASPDDFPKTKEENGTLDHLIQMLRLVTKMPGELQGPVVELVVKELQKQMTKRSGEVVGTPIESGSLENSLSEESQGIVDKSEKTMLTPPIYPKIGGTNTCSSHSSINGRSHSLLQSGTIAQTTTSARNDQQHGGVKYASLVNESCTGVLGYIPKNVVTPEHSGNLLLDSQGTVTPTVSSSSQSIPKDISKTQPKNLLPLKESTENYSNYYLQIDSSDYKINFTDNLHVNTSSNCLPKQNGPEMLQRQEHNSQAFDLSPVELSSSFLNVSTKAHQTDTDNHCLGSSSDHISVNTSLASLTTVQPLVQQYALTQEARDPLLSHAYGPASVDHGATANEVQTTDIGVSMINHPPSSEMPLTQLSENELLNYINPTCFDNV